MAADLFELCQYAGTGSIVVGLARSLSGVPWYHRPTAYAFGAAAGLGAYYVISSVNQRLEQSKEERFQKLMDERKAAASEAS